MKSISCVLALAGLAVGLTLTCHQEAQAIAAFSREYNTECISCHAGFPRRNAFGEAFEKNGYVWPGRERTSPPEGQEALWLSGLPRSIPLSVSLWADTKYDPDLENDKISPNAALMLHAGGSIRDELGFFAHDVTSRGGEAFGMFRRVLGTPLNVKFGRFTPKTTLQKANQVATLTLPAPLSFAVPDGAGPLVTPRDAVEINTVLNHNWFLAGGVGDKKNQDAMEFFVHLSRRIGGTDFLGEEPEIDFDVESIWDYLALTVGGFGYYGTAEQVGFETTSWRAGAEAEAVYKGLSCLLSWVFARDDDIDGTGTEVDSAVLSWQFGYYLAPSYMFTVRLEDEDVGNSEGGAHRRAVGQVSYFWNQNVGLRLEGTYDRAEKGEDRSTITGWFRVDLHL